jgi:hypothetical protein
MIPKLALMVITDGRWDYLQRTLESAAVALDWPWHQKILVDDSGEEKGFSPDGFEFVKNTPRRGLAGAIQSGWDALDKDIDYVFHLEDDFIFPDLVDIELMIEILEYEPELAQVALLRQPWSPEEQQAGGIYSIEPERFKQKYGFVQQSHLFTFNPCLYPIGVARDYQAGLEAELTADLLADDWRFGYLGELGDDPKTIHIGIRRSRNYQL